MNSRMRTTVAALVVAAVLSPNAGAASATPSLSNSNSLIAAALRSIEGQFPQASRISADKVAHAAINGILREIDASGSSYIYRAKDGKAPGGLPRPALTVQLVEGVPTIVSVLPHTDPFFKELVPGDVLLRVGDTTVVGKTVHDIYRLLEGEAGSTVKLTLYRKSAQKFLEASVKREAVASAAYGRNVGRNVGYLQVNILDSKGVELLRARLEDLLKQKPIGLVLDLRSTTGGTVEDAIAAAGLFLSEAPVVKVQERESAPQSRAAAKGAPATVPLVLICDFGTNGAAEVLASALQDDKRAVVIGQKSFGLASAQSAISLDPDNQLQLTTAYYLSPSGREISIEGVKPDIVTRSEPPQGEELVKFRREFTHFCRGEAAATASAPRTSSASSTAETTATTGAAEAEEDHGEEEEDLPGGKPKVKTSDGILEDYKLVKHHDSQLVRAINILISANIFFEYGQHQK